MSKVVKLHIEYLLAKRMGLLFLSYSHFSCCLFRFALFCSLLLSFCYLLVHFPLVVWVSIFFVSMYTYLQQSICIVFISCIVGFALSCCLLLSSCCLLDHFPCCLVFP